jgi:hypothetical protein
MVNYDDNRRDISIETIPGPRTQSRLIIKEPQLSDSGNYTCRASNTEPASIYVYVSKGKHPLFLFFIFISTLLVKERATQRIGLRKRRFKSPNMLPIQYFIQRYCFSIIKMRNWYWTFFQCSNNDTKKGRGKLECYL